MANEKGALVFIVDDDAAMRDSLAILLEIEQIPTEIYASPAEFLSEARPSKDDCLVVDARMPGMSGVDLLDHLVGKGIEISVLMITGHGDHEVIEAAEKRGVLKCFQKPFSGEELLASIRQALSMKE